MKGKRMLCALLCAVMSTALFAACVKEKASTDTQKEQLTVWMPLVSNAAMVMNNFAESALAKELMKRTNVTVTYQHPPQGQESEKFSIMVASVNLPDIIEYNWLNYPGGPQKAIKEGVIIDLNQHEKQAVNLFSYLGENPAIKKLAVTDTGALFSFPFVRGDESLNVSGGLIIRRDWLDELKLPMPETIDEWETILTAFRDKKGAAAPFSSSFTDYFASAYNTTASYYLDDHNVRYGLMDPSFKDYLARMNSWYSQKLIDPNFAATDAKTIDANVLNGLAGATNGSIGSGIGKWMAAAKDVPGFSLEGAPIPVLEKGARPKFGQYQLPVTSSITAFDAITTSCKNVEAAIRYLDYGYGGEGRMLYNFGIEGESYEMKDGYPTYTEKIVNNPEGHSMAVALASYTRSWSTGPFVQDKRYMEQYAALPQQKRAWETWSATDAAKHALPHLYVKDEELTEYAKLKSAIDTYASEMILKFIIGSEPLQNYDAMVEQLHTRGIDKVLTMLQSAYGRYLEK